MSSWRRFLGRRWGMWWWGQGAQGLNAGRPPAPGVVGWSMTMPCSVPVAVKVMLAMPYMALGSDPTGPQLSPQLLPQPVKLEATYGPHSLPGAPVPFTVTSFTFLMFTAGGLAFMAARIAAVVSVLLSTVLPDMEPMA